jgi:hypothetical protein
MTKPSLTLVSESRSAAEGGSRLFVGRWGELTVAPILSATAVAATRRGFQASKCGGAMTVALAGVSVLFLVLGVGAFILLPTLI